MERAFLLGLMEENMKENIKMIKNMDTDVFIGVMENNIKGIGKMGKKMGRGKFIILKKKNGKKVCGKMV